MSQYGEAPDSTDRGRFLLFMYFMSPRVLSEVRKKYIDVRYVMLNRKEMQMVTAAQDKVRYSDLYY